MREFIAKLAYVGRRMGVCTDPIVDCVFDGRQNTTSITELVCLACTNLCCLWPLCALFIAILAATAIIMVWGSVAMILFLISIVIAAIFNIDVTYGTHANYVMLVTVLVVSSITAGTILVASTIAVISNMR